MTRSPRRRRGLPRPSLLGSGRRRRMTRDQLIKRAARQGWRRHGWKKALRERLALMVRRNRGLREFQDEIPETFECLDAFRCRPTGWRLRVEGRAEEWGHSVLVLEFLQIGLTQRQLVEFKTLWWRLDTSELMHLRVFLMDRTGRISPLVTDETIHDHLRDETK